MISEDNLVEGIVVKAYGGYYYVHDGREVWECNLRGRFRHEKRQVLVGDRVQLKPRHGREGVIEDILPRRTALVRPPVANVEQAVIVFAFKEPDPNPGLLDRFLIAAAMNNVEPLICFNKVDLVDDGGAELVSHYRGCYRVMVVSTRTNEGLDCLKEALRGKISVFAGPSGVGKSSILNALLPGLKLKTGDVSEKIRRGRHTTRHVELIFLPEGGLVADTPGFSSLDLPSIEPEGLAAYFPEMEAYYGKCYFTGCLHYKEPGCAVREAVEIGRIRKERYRQYLDFLKELMSRRKY